MASARLRRHAVVPPRVSGGCHNVRIDHTRNRYCPNRPDHAGACRIASRISPRPCQRRVCYGTFRGAREARGVSRAPHLQGDAVPTVIRFSNASGDPDVHDGTPNARAMAVKFQLPDGKKADILALSIEGFPARTPEDFLAFLQAQLPDPATGQPRPDAFPRFLEKHPSTAAFIQRLTQKPVPASYGQSSYHAEHAFKFTAADGTSRFGRYHWMPEAGKPISRLMMRASATRTSCARSWRAACGMVPSYSAFSCNWPSRAIRWTMLPPCGRRTGLRLS